MRTTAVILAAGQGKRMLSPLPKVLHPVAGKPMVSYSIAAAKDATGEKPVLIIGHGAEQVREFVGSRAHFAYQHQQFGTGHAVKQAESFLNGKSDLILILSADMPLLTKETMQRLIWKQKSHSGPITMLTVVSAKPRGFGRIIRGTKGSVDAIVEEAEATPEQLAIQELNAGVYCIASEWLWDALNKIPVSSKGEYYVTDLVGIAVSEGLSVQAIHLEDASEAIGINNQDHLREANDLMKLRFGISSTN
jgi:bifunctional UDP-N-acetylglucosamine pyrophosphorylase/glucosamine-1-phosphate N-acetyltransferase